MLESASTAATTRTPHADDGPRRDRLAGNASRRATTRRAVHPLPPMCERRIAALVRQVEEVENENLEHAAQTGATDQLLDPDFDEGFEVSYAPQPGSYGSRRSFLDEGAEDFD